ncbi:hypothetical protein J6590_030374 [Homalodisca vitripennis]|nr:hypothetical protein J6590_030374 [Homalodisca vitripennis]
MSTMNHPEDVQANFDYDLWAHCGKLSSVKKCKTETGNASNEHPLVKASGGGGNVSSLVEGQPIMEQHRLLITGFQLCIL